VQAINSKEALKITHYKVKHRPRHVTFHLSRVTCHVSRVTHHTLLSTPITQGKAKDVGHILLDGSSATLIPRFIDYLSGGLEMRMLVQCGVWRVACEVWHMMCVV